MTTDRARDVDYLRRRESQERSLADRAADAAARRVHLDLAERYAARIGGMSASPALNAA